MKLFLYFFNSFHIRISKSISDTIIEMAAPLSFKTIDNKEHSTKLKKPAFHTQATNFLEYPIFTKPIMP